MDGGQDYKIRLHTSDSFYLKVQIDHPPGFKKGGYDYQNSSAISIRGPVLGEVVLVMFPVIEHKIKRHRIKLCKLSSERVLQVSVECTRQEVRSEKAAEAAASRLRAQVGGVEQAR